MANRQIGHKPIVHHYVTNAVTIFNAKILRNGAKKREKERKAKTILLGQIQTRARTNQKPETRADDEMLNWMLTKYLIELIKLYIRFLALYFK